MFLDVYTGAGGDLTKKKCQGTPMNMKPLIARFLEPRLSFGDLRLQRILSRTNYSPLSLTWSTTLNTWFQCYLITGLFQLFLANIRLVAASSFGCMSVNLQDVGSGARKSVETNYCPRYQLRARQ